MKMIVQEIKSRMKKLGSKERAAISRKYFKTGPGEYAEGDVFLGLRAPVLRRLSEEYEGLTLGQVQKLLKSGVHEERLLALLVLVRKFARAGEATRKRIFALYMKNTRYVNNWDLVDTSAEQIVGAYLHDKSRKPIHVLARSRDLWERRISIVSTFYYIKRGSFSETLEIASLLLDDEEDLIEKAVGWMLREVGKRDLASEERFLKKYYKRMPRTMLRYSIERFPEAKRLRYLKGRI
jgi:3-methyladenine DNA glycosylase AlkD